MSADDAYAYCATLTRDQWAWEFLRRNPDYQADYRQFIAIWRALEADYGAPPNRDFARWKQDPRAYGPLPGQGEPETTTGELCAAEDERVLLECWLGAKWGFYKFPLDPARISPGPDELSWRPPPPRDEAAIEAPYRLDIAFDLSLPLPEQLEAARFRLVSRAAELRRQDVVAPKTVANQREQWITMLRLLDSVATANREKRLADEALSLVAGAYQEILRFTEGRT